MDLYDDEGNAAELNFGKEFNFRDTLELGQLMCLTNDDLYQLLQTDQLATGNRNRNKYVIHSILI